MWRTIPDQDMDYHYSPSQWQHRMGPVEVVEEHIMLATNNSKEALLAFDVEEVSYGDSERQKLDILHKKNTSKKGAPIFCWLHGGYWQRKELKRENSSYMALSLCNAGASVVAVGYDLCPDVTLQELILQVKTALQMVIKLAKEKQSSGVYIGGHSAGGHLAAMMLSYRFSEDDANDFEYIKGAVLCGGVFDVRPITKIYAKDALGLTEDEAWKLSPMNCITEIIELSAGRHILTVIGDNEPSEYRRQGKEMEEILRDNGVKSSLIDLPDTDHYNMVNRLSDPDYILTKEIIHLMKL